MSDFDPDVFREAIDEYRARKMPLRDPSTYDHPPTYRLETYQDANGYAAMRKVSTGQSDLSPAYRSGQIRGSLTTACHCARPRLSGSTR